MKRYIQFLQAAGIGVLVLIAAPSAHAALSLTAGSNATTTPNVATSITGFQIVGPAASSTPVKLRATNGTLNLSTVSGVTMSGNGSGTVSLSGLVSNLNTALATLTYTRSSTGTDTLEVSLVEATEVFFEDNGHLYKYISDTGDWNAAKTKAEAQTLYGATGYLATITSSGENAFVTARLSNAGWMGASDSSSEGVWRWVTGPESGTQFWSGASGGSAVGGNYANWNTGEPNDSGSNEDCGQYLSGGSGKWNDLPCSSTTLPGYVAEFGATGNMPQVVAQNISVVTADVPAITSLSPANGATNVSATANLVIGFSKSVTKDTGSILIKRSSDDALVESIDVSGALVTGGGTNSITINPATTFAEGVGYYVIIPSTAFKDSSNNYFDGISSETTWAFSIPDQTPPVISAIATSSVATTTASITWTTDEAASTKVVYSIDNTYASSTSETDTGSRVTSHTKALSSLSACTTYTFKTVSADSSGNYATSSASSFTTIGCPGNAIPAFATTTAVTVSATSSTSLTDSGRTMTVETPANFTATSSTVVIQIKSLDSATVLSTITEPSGVVSAADIVFDVTALLNSVTVLDSFDLPVTMTYAYTDEDIVGLEESSLWMYHYHNASWRRLSDCSINESANTITCTAPSFSIFGVFGTPIVTSSESSSGGKTGTSITRQVANLINMGNVARAEEIKKEWPNLFPGTDSSPSSSTNMLGVRDLELHMSGTDVRKLQQLLNANGFALAENGVGAPGSETEYFGTLTKNALARFQSAHGVVPSVGYFGPLTRAKMTELGISGVWW